MQNEQLDEGFEEFGTDYAATRIAFGAAVGEEHGVGVFHAAVVDEFAEELHLRFAKVG